MSSLATRTQPVPTPTPELRSQFASHPVPVQAGTTLRRILFATLDRADQVAPEHADVWEQFVRILEQNQSDPRSTARCAVLANMVALLVFDEPADYAATVELAAQVGQPRLARLQHRAAIALEADPTLPWTSTVVRRLVRWDLAARLGRPAAGGVDEDVATTCAVIAQNLVFEDIDPERAATEPITSVAQLHDLVDRGSIIDWRQQLGAIAASPWGPYADQLLEIGHSSDRPSTLGRDRERDRAVPGVVPRPRARPGRPRDPPPRRGERLVPARVRLAHRHLAVPPVHLRPRHGHPVGRDAAAHPAGLPHAAAPVHPHGPRTASLGRTTRTATTGAWWEPTGTAGLGGPRSRPGSRALPTRAAL